MAFLDKLGDLARNIGDKTSEAIETAKINSRIGAEKTAIAECMRRIGEIYYRKHQEGDSCDPAATELLVAIDGHNRAIADAQAEIERIKTKSAPGAAPPAQPAGADCAVCQSCGRANPAGMKFCQECGAKIEAPPPPPAPSVDGIVCPSCGRTNPAGMKFCQGCGAKIEAPASAERSCPGCGAPIPAANKFCGGCGHRFE
jgi:hypothetical protein